LFLSLRPDVSLAPGEDGELLFQSADARIAVKRLAPGASAALQRLANPGEYEDQLAELALEADGPEELPRLYHSLHQLTRRGLLLRSACQSGERLATLVPISPSFVFRAARLTPDCRYLLSRFAYLRAERGDTLLESPRSHARVILHDWRASAAVHVLGRSCRVADLAEQIPGLSADAAEQVISLLVAANMIGERSEEGISAGDDSPALQTWEFHDLLFHARSREGRHDALLGGTYRFVGKLDPPPALKSVRSQESIELYRPDLERLQREDPPFARVQETRCSIREYDDRPITDRQLGEFLYRVGRVKEYGPFEVPTPHGPVRMDFAARPYPAGGGLYELELYATVNACENLTPGLYHYDPLNHRLERLAGPTGDVEQLLVDASRATGIPRESLQVLLVIAARFQRVAWKYEAMAYALTLKHVGVLYQTMYLAATAMGLAPCGVGSGNSDVFARAAGADYYAETSVGEFLLGSRGVS
jgi:SagB-type dehydrogenase family enzyme